MYIYLDLLTFMLSILYDFYSLYEQKLRFLEKQSIAVSLSI